MWTRVLQFLKEPTGAALAKGSLVVLVFKVIGALGTSLRAEAKKEDVSLCLKIRHHRLCLSIRTGSDLLHWNIFYPLVENN